MPTYADWQGSKTFLLVQRIKVIILWFHATLVWFDFAEEGHGDQVFLCFILNFNLLYVWKIASSENSLKKTTFITIIDKSLEKLCVMIINGTNSLKLNVEDD